MVILSNSPILKCSGRNAFALAFGQNPRYTNNCLKAKPAISEMVIFAAEKQKHQEEL